MHKQHGHGQAAPGRRLECVRAVSRMVHVIGARAEEPIARERRGISLDVFVGQNSMVRRHFWGRHSRSEPTSVLTHIGRACRFALGALGRLA